MVVLFGFRNKVQKDIWADKFQCPNCGQVSDFYVHKVKLIGHIFYVPILSRTVNRLLACNTCQIYREISKAEYKNIKNGIKNWEIPSNAIVPDANPKRIRYGIRIMMLVLAIVYCLFMLGGSIAIVTKVPDWDASVTIGVLFMVIAGMLPLVFAIRGVIRASRERKVYSSVTIFEKGEI